MQAATRKLAEGVLRGERFSLSKAITLVESSKMSHRHEAQLLLEHVTTHGRTSVGKLPGAMASATATSTVPPPRGSAALASLLSDPRKRFDGHSVRLGIAGPPGAGKSTLIEALGTWLTTQADQRVAVLTIDPSSSRTGGSILGDKTRMELLSRDPNAFVRASPSSGVLGGLAMYTRDVVSLCESAGYSVVIVETVGLGQSEIEIDMAVDVVALVMSPGGGDELQGVKKGIVEVADVVVVNKADGDLLPAAQRTQAEYRLALQLCRPKLPGWTAPVLATSALTASSSLTGMASLGSTTYESNFSESAKSASAASSPEADACASSSSPSSSSPKRSKRGRGASAHKGLGPHGGIDDLWAAVEECHAHLRASPVGGSGGGSGAGAGGDCGSGLPPSPAAPTSFLSSAPSSACFGAAAADADAGDGGGSGEQTPMTALDVRRQRQAQHWMMEELRHSLFRLVFDEESDSQEGEGGGQQPRLRDLARQETAALASNSSTPRAAAARVLEAAIARLVHSSRK